MEAGALIVLSVLAAGAVGVALWMAMERAKWLGKYSEAEGARQGAEEEVGRAQEQAAAARRAAQEAEGRVAAAQVVVEGLKKTLEAERAAHEAEVRTVREMAEERMRAAGAVHAEKLAAVEQARGEIARRLAEFDERLQKAFGSLAADALKQSSEQFLKLAEQNLDRRRAAVDELVRPIAETLKKTDEKLAAMERERVAAYTGVLKEVQQISSVNAELRAETGRLVRALREPQVRGRYGEMQLRRVAELAGMSSYCDFTEQDQTRDSEGNSLRPDMLVNLPNGRHLAIDAKTNIQAYIEAIEAATPDEAEACLERFARHVAEQATALGKKNYWERYDGSPEFVVMFVPGDQFIDAALQRRPDLLEKAASTRVILASPSTLIGLLKAVAVGWREKRLEEQARELFDLGRQLHERAAVISEHLERTGAALEQAVKRFNDVVGSYQTRLEPTLRKFEEAGAKSAKELAAVSTVTIRPRLGAGGAGGLEGAGVDGVASLDGAAPRGNGTGGV